MGDAAILRAKLSKTDMSQPGIQGSAAAMMKLYDRAAPLAVSEWRSALQTCRLDQLLPLLYVANEVLQTSKRNRGPKFLEAFGEVLGSSLRFMCERDRSIVEKVRRTTKIWGDRQVYSARFVGQLLAGLEDLRGGAAASSPSPQKAASSSSSSSSAQPSTASTAAAASGGASAAGERKRSVADEEDKTDGDENDNAFSSPFGSSGGQSLLSIDITASAAAAAGTPGGGVGSKRRRSSRSSSPVPGGKASSSSQKGTKNGNSKKPAKKKKVAKSTSALVTLLKSLTECDVRFRSSQGTVDSIDESHLNDSEDALADVVGDELADLNRGAAAAVRTLKRQHRAFHGIASEKRVLEGEVASYVPWLRAAMKADEEELRFCDKLEKSLEAIGIVHAEAKDARHKRRAEEAERSAKEEAERRAKQEEEERKRSLEEAMKTPNQEAKPDMKWNPVLREYQYVGDVTEESWRD